MTLKGDIKKTLEALRRAGKTGVHSLHLNALVGTTRSAARVGDLIKLGYNISNNDGKREKLGNSFGVRYTLLEDIQETVDITYQKDGYEFIKQIPRSQLKPEQQSLF